MFLKEKHTGQIKVRMCDGGRKKRSKSNKKSATYPIEATESVLIATSIDSTKRRDITVVDVLEAFLTANMDEEVILLLIGELSEIMESISPTAYKDYVSIGNTGENMLYVRLDKALYSCLCSVLLFYKKL